MLWDGLESPMKMLLGCPAGSDRNQVVGLFHLFTSKLTFKSLYGKTVSFSVLSNLKYFIPRPNKKYLLPRHPEDQFDPLLDLQSARRPIIRFQRGLFGECPPPKHHFWSPERGSGWTFLGLAEVCKRGVRLHAFFGRFLGTLRTLLRPILIIESKLGLGFHAACRLRQLC